MISHLSLNDFRVHRQFVYGGDHDWILLEGPNGAGKTSIIEAISFLAPGRGLRNVAFADVIRKPQNQWSLFAELKQQDITIGMSCAKRRIIKIDGKVARSSMQLLEHLRVMWLTPAEDGLLGASKAVRRKLLDRLTYNFFPQHVEVVLKYEYLLKSRLKLLKEKSSDDIWLHRLEIGLAEESVQILQNRQATIERLRKWMLHHHQDFITPKINMTCMVQNSLRILPSIAELQHHITKEFEKSRSLDAALGKSMYGVHRADFVIGNHSKDVMAQQSSTGELKMMLISLMVAQIHSLNQSEKISPIVLLDDIFSHIDPHYCQKLLEKLRSIRAQIWITGTQLDMIYPLLKNENFIKICI